MTEANTTRRSVVLCALALAFAMGPIAGFAHQMFLIVPSHHLPADADVTLSLYNGTYEQSENVIDRDRMIDISVVDSEGRVSHPESSQWREEGNVTLLDFRTGKPGTYGVGVSTRANMIELTGEEFNEYLEHDGLLDELEARRAQGQLDQPARERYSKHVKTLLEVGGATSDGWAKRLGYPIEIVPLANPFELTVGDALEVLVLHEGKPAAQQLVYASYESYEPSATGQGEAAVLRTDDSGKATIELAAPGRWYIRLIRMLEAPDPDADYESNWATLTFEIGE